MTDSLPTPDQIIAASTAARLPNWANAVTGIYGISGSGKSSLADTAAEHCFADYGKISLCYAADLGGFGNKRLVLIRRGIMRVYDPRNHINPFETMELISRGAFPVTLIDPERGFAAPDVPLILPHRVVHTVYCPQGHVAAQFDNERTMQITQTACPSCGVVTGLANCQRVEKAIVRHRMFKDVGLRIYDSMTALNEWGMSDLQDQSAKGTLPAGGGGGSLLGAADALRSGQFVFGSSSVGQYGFLQNRTYGWLANIRSIPDQVLPAIATFMVEESKGTDESGGERLLGPKIAGNARTAAMGGWLGNLTHASKEPASSDLNAPMVHRLWLTNHIDPRDPRRIPYIAKHRGTPLGMPEFLEDVPGAQPWSRCSMAVFFMLLRRQLELLEAESVSQHPNTPGMWTGEAADGSQDEVVGVVGGVAGVASGQAMPAGGQPGSPAPLGATLPAGSPVAAAKPRRRVAGQPAGPAAVVAPVPAGGQAEPSPTVPETENVQSTAAAPVAVQSADVGPASAPSVIAQQLAASLAARGVPPIMADQIAVGPAGAETTIASNGGGAAADVPANASAAMTTAPVSLQVPSVAPPPSIPPATDGAQSAVPIRRRVARPPV